MKLTLAIAFAVTSIVVTPGVSAAADKSCKSGYDWNASNKKCERVSSY